MATSANKPKPVAKRIALWFTIAVTSYFVLYFSSVQWSVGRSSSPVTPRPGYIQSNEELARAVFAPAHFIDASLLRRDYWAPKPPSSPEPE